MNLNFNPEIEFANHLDERDDLKEFRKRFFIADENTIYLDGNSLGRLPHSTNKLISELTEKQWGTHLIESWNNTWYKKPEELGNKIATIIGASEGEVIVTDSTSVNLYKLAHAALVVQKEKKKIVSDVFNFPTDLYILQGIIRNFGNRHKLVLAKQKDDISIDLEDLKSKIDEETGLVVLSMVAFKSSFLYNIAEITNWAHKNGALVLWDLSHAAGAVPVELNKINADLAVGCTYKYLNGGPGSPAYLYVRKDLQENLFSPIQGWFGEEKPFEFEMNYRPAKGIHKFLAGTPPIISLMAVESGLNLITEAGIHNIHNKSILQTEYFVFLVKEILTEYYYELGSPANYKYRGSHVSLKHTEAFRICQALIRPKSLTIKIIPDFREPDNIRFGFVPLYTTFFEIWQTVQRLKEIVVNKEFENFSFSKVGVT